MTTPSPSLAKQRVLAWVRSKNPQTQVVKRVVGDTYRGIKPYKDRDTCFPSIKEAVIKELDMGLQELLIAAKKEGLMIAVLETGEIEYRNKEICCFDLTQNLHNQPDQFYLDILPLLPTP